MNSIQQISYSGWEGFNISRNIESAEALGETIKQVALPIIESLGNTAFNALRAVGEVGAKVIAFTAMGVAATFAGLLLAGVTGVASLIIYGMVTDVPKEEIAKNNVVSEEVKTAVEEVIVEEVALEVKEALIAKVVSEEKPLISAVETEVASEVSYDKREIAIDSGDVY